MINWKGPGGYFNFTGTAKSAGKLIVQGSRLGMVVKTVASGEIGTAITSGVYSYAKKSTDVFTLGLALWYDAGNDEITLTSTSNTFAGFATAAAANPSSTCEFELVGGHQPDLT